VVKSISRAAGWMKDSDWVNAEDSFDVYSESRTRGEALLWNANVDYIFIIRRRRIKRPSI